jgi:hypothetical protein
MKDGNKQVCYQEKEEVKELMLEEQQMEPWLEVSFTPMKSFNELRKSWLVS